LGALSQRVSDKQMPSAQTLPSRLRLLAPGLEQAWRLRVEQERTSARRSIKITRLNPPAAFDVRDAADGSVAPAASADKEPEPDALGSPTTEPLQSRQGRHPRGMKLPPDLAAQADGRGGRSL
jgi:hypothetical protein